MSDEEQLNNQNNEFQGPQRKKKRTGTETYIQGWADIDPSSNSTSPPSELVQHQGVQASISESMVSWGMAPTHSATGFAANESAPCVALSLPPCLVANLLNAGI